MSTDSPNAAGDAMELESLIQSLPACKRCRDCRRGCDTFLPKCRQCTKAGVDCIYHDHGRNKFLSRSYIAELVDHVRRLTEQNNSSPPNSASTPQEAPLPISIKTESIASTAASVASTVPEVQPNPQHFFAFAANTYRYIGSESCLVRSPRLEPQQSSSVPDDDDDWHLSWKQTPAKSYELVEVFLETIQPLYPILDTTARYLDLEIPFDLTDVERFTLNMIYSIACHILPATARRRHPTHAWNLSYHSGNYIRYRTMADTYFETAMKFLEASTTEPTIDTLRAVLLMAINSLFNPKSGNIGQQVALASRLVLNLESQIEQQESGSSESKMLRNMHSTIFSIENELASTLDRPATFPEPEWELSFSPEEPADFQCSLYRLQHRFRKSDAEGKEALKKYLPPLDTRSELLPGLRMALHQTHLVFNPCWQCAWYVLETVVSIGSIHIFSTPHWVYRAATIMIQNMPSILPGNIVQLYSNALVILELSSMKWPSSASLCASLSQTMEHAVNLTQPAWSGQLQHHDVRI